MYERAIEILEGHIAIDRMAVAEWENEANPSRSNEVRAESLRQRIEEVELAIECLKRTGMPTKHANQREKGKA